MEVNFIGRLERGNSGSLGMLNRIATVTENGLEYEADQRHAEILMRDVGVVEGSKGVATPGVSAGEGGQAREVQVGGESLFRAAAARRNSLGQGRVDMQFAAKEIPTFASNPEQRGWRSAEMRARHLKDDRRVVIGRKFQKLPGESGGAVRRGLCWTQGCNNVNFRRRRDVREPLRQNAHPDTGDGGTFIGQRESWSSTASSKRPRWGWA